MRCCEKVLRQKLSSRGDLLKLSLQKNKQTNKNKNHLILSVNVFRAEHLLGTLSSSNWNLEVLVFKERGKSEYPEKNLSEQGREPTTNLTKTSRVELP